MSKKTITFEYYFSVRIPINIDVEYELDEKGEVENFEIVNHELSDIDYFTEDQLCESLCKDPDECYIFVRQLSEAIEDQGEV